MNEKTYNDYTLGELKKENESRINEAEELGVFDRLLSIGRWLGKPVETDNHGVFYIYVCDSAVAPISPIIVVYRESEGRLVAAAGSETSWETVQSVGVYLGPADVDIFDLDMGGIPTYYKGLRACRYQKSTHPTGNEIKFIAPGKWTDIVLDHYERAREIEREAALIPFEKERRDLFERMLLDKDI